MSAKVVVTGTGIQMLNVTINGGASADIFISAGVNIAIAGNKVQSTLADGIHITGRSRNILVQDNAVTLVAAIGNRISRADFGCLRALGSVCQFQVSGNTFASISGGAPISLQSRNRAASQIIGKSNTLNGAAFASPAGCPATGTLSIVGANPALRPQVRSSVRQMQQSLIDSQRTQNRG